MSLVTGDKAVDRVLAGLESKVVQDLMRPAIAAGQRVVVKAMQASVPPKLRDAKTAIGARFNKSRRTGELMGKAGAAVGMKAVRIAKAAAKQQGKRAGRPGIGVGARNIMWFILGTAKRFTGSTRVRSDKTGRTRKSNGKSVHSTGSMPSQGQPIREGFARSAGSCLTEIARVARATLPTLIAKL